MMTPTALIELSGLFVAPALHCTVRRVCLVGQARITRSVLLQLVLPAVA
jgi:hypothetical protein